MKINQAGAFSLAWTSATAAIIGICAATGPLARAQESGGDAGSVVDPYNNATVTKDPLVEVTLVNPNDPAISRLEYRLNEGEWQDYEGPFQLKASEYLDGAAVEARSVAIELYWDDSPEAQTAIGQPSVTDGGGTQLPDDEEFVWAPPRKWKPFWDWYEDSPHAKPGNGNGNGNGNNGNGNNGHGNNGHGNNEDGVDVSNPGNGNGGPNGEEDPSGTVDDEGGNGNGGDPAEDPDEEAESNGNGNNGHGNNADGVDVSNPGNGNGGPNGQEDPSGDVDDEAGGGNGNGNGNGNGKKK